MNTAGEFFLTLMRGNQTKRGCMIVQNEPWKIDPRKMRKSSCWITSSLIPKRSLSITVSLPPTLNFFLASRTKKMIECTPVDALPIFLEQFGDLFPLHHILPKQTNIYFISSMMSIGIFWNKWKNLRIRDIQCF